MDLLEHLCALDLEGDDNCTGWKTALEELEDLGKEKNTEVAFSRANLLATILVTQFSLNNYPRGARKGAVCYSITRSRKQGLKERR
jgi:hypothetical protein